MISQEQKAYCLEYVFYDLISFTLAKSKLPQKSLDFEFLAPNGTISTCRGLTIRLPNSVIDLLR